jgi:hypothetical protein
LNSHVRKDIRHANRLIQSATADPISKQISGQKTDTDENGVDNCSEAEAVHGGGLISYGIDQTELVREAAPYVDRILCGANPAELPVQSPTKYQLVINLKTANALGLNVPNSMQLLADEVIE